MIFRLLLAAATASGLVWPQEPPPAPTGLAATTPANAQIELNWNDNPPTVAGYNVYRSNVSQGAYSKLNGSLLATSGPYTDTTVVPGTRYFYVVRAEISGPIESANSGEVNAVATGTDSTPPAAPIITSQTRKTRDTTPSTSGTAEPGTTVRVYAGSTEIGSTSAALNGIWTVANPSALGADGVYSITARATDAALNQSAASTAIQITLDTTAPATPTNIRTTAYYNCVDLEWTASTSSDLAGYKIQRKTGAGSWTTLNSNLVLGTRYRDSTVTSGVTYQYRVISVDNALDY